MDLDELDRSLVLDGNAAAGRLMEMFGAEMTANDAECAGCGAVHAMGALMAYTQSPGIVLRCPSCGSVMLRVVETPRGIYVDARGSAVMVLSRR